MEQRSAAERMQEAAMRKAAAKARPKPNLENLPGEEIEVC